MQVQVETISPTQRKVLVTIPAKDVDQAFDKAYKAVGKNAQIPGFRPGKAPRGLIEAHYGDKVMVEVQHDLVAGSLSKAMQDHDLSPVATPAVNPGKLARGDDFSFTAELEVQPEIHLNQYKGLHVAPVTVTVEEAEVEGQLTKMREQAAQLVPVMIRDVVQKGDVVMMDYEAFVGGAPLAGGKADNALIEVGSEGYLPALSDGLIGAKVPSEREVPVKFPEDYTAKEVAGKEATFKVKVKELKQKELPKLDDDFAKDIGSESLEALKTKIKDAVLAQKQRAADDERKNALMKALVAANPFDLPPSLVSAQADRMIASATMRVQQMMGQKMQLSDAELEALRKDSTTDAEQQVRAGLLLLEVAKAEELTVEPAETDKEVETMARMSGEEAHRVRAYYNDSEHRMGLVYRLLEEKTVKFLLEHAAATAEDAAKAPKAEPKKKAHAHKHTHAHGHEGHEHAHDEHHVHGPDCNHDHDHEHAHAAHAHDHAHDEGDAEHGKKSPKKAAQPKKTTKKHDE